MKAIGNPFGCKVNDVFLAVCAGALARWLELRHELPPTPLIAGSPVAMRKAGNHSRRNGIGLLITSLETHLTDPLERLLAIRDSAAIAKAVQAECGNVGLADVNVPGLPLALGGIMSLADRLRIGDLLPLPVNVVIANVAGPRRQVWLHGAVLRSHFPVSTPLHGVALNITVQSYLDRMDFGLTACRDAVPDLTNLRDFMDDAFEDLWLAAGMPRVSSGMPNQSAERDVGTASAAAIPNGAAVAQAARGAIEWAEAPHYRLGIGANDADCRKRGAAH